ncbi:MAG: DUF4852 domain-containing protein, partial [Alphaproteobacteria bacterium]|nr:DUF4852 domain-containing protein [Alphaproteobacteria bacterium]
MSPGWGAEPVLPVPGTTILSAPAEPAPVTAQTIVAVDRSLYAAPTIKSFSDLYWALGKLDPNTDEHVDKYVIISDCETYRKYYQNEFEWGRIRDETRAMVAANKSTFPLRFRFLLPIKFGEYDFNRKGFNVLKEYQIPGIRRFEFVADDYNYGVCNLANYTLGAYPKAVIADLSRPVDLNFIPVPEDKAKAYLDVVSVNANPRLMPGNPNFYDYRSAYIALYIKFFSYQTDTIGAGGVLYAQLQGVLESIEVLASPDD